MAIKYLNALAINGNGGTVLDVQGSQGQLFSVTDSLTGDIFAVSDISGVPILKVNSSGLSTFDGNVLLADGTLTVGADAAGRDVMFRGGTSGAYFMYDASEDGVVIVAPTDKPALGIRVVGGAQATVPQFQVGRGTSQYLGIRVDDRISSVIHRQDETTGVMQMNQEIWDNGTGVHLWNWKSYDGSGSSGSTRMTLNKTGELDVLTSVTSTTFLGDLNGTINTATVGTTQTAGTGGTLIATCGYADAAAAALPNNYLTNNASDTLRQDQNADTSLTIRNNTSGTAGSASLDLRASGNNFDLTTHSDLFTGKLNVTEFKSTAGSSSFQFSPASTTVMEMTATAVTVTGNISATNLSGTNTGDQTIPTVGDGEINGATSGLGITGSMSATANQTGNTTFTVTSNAVTAATASTIAYRDSSADLNVRLLRASYANQSTISGAMAFRVNNGTDNYTRYCSSCSAIRTFLGVPASGDLGNYVTLATVQTISGAKTFNNDVVLNNTNLTGVDILESNTIKIKSTLLSNQENTDIDSAAAEVVAQVSITDYTAAFFDFVVKKGTNVRSGTVYACHDGTNVEFTETSTNDLGDTSDVTLSVDKTSTSLRLIATVTSNDWSVKSLIRAI